MKLLSYLQSQNISRRQITSLIDAWSVLVNGLKVESYKQEVQEGDEVTCGDIGKYVVATAVQNSSHLLVFYKPLGYVCSKADPHNPTIYELLPEEFKQYYYIGRLDKNSRGLVLMTDDPKLVDQYEHPRHGITKEYIITLNKPFKEMDKQRCLAGIEDDGELLKCIECKIKPDSSEIKMVLNEGKKRHIRRMMSALRYHVEDLMRVREGKFELRELKEGEWKLVAIG